MILASADRIARFRAAGYWGDLTVDAAFRANVAKVPEREAVIDAPNREVFTDGSPQRLTYRTLDAAVDRLAAVLLAHGIGRDDVIAVQLPNIVELTMSYLAAARIGAIVTPVPVQYREYELQYCLSHTGAKVVLTVTRVGNHEHAAMFARMRHDVPQVRHIMAWGETARMPAAVVALEAAMAEVSGQATSLNGAGAALADDILTICWTSGTEARPKGVPRSHNEWLVVAPNIVEVSGLQDGARILNPSPMVNMSGVSINLATWIHVAGTVVHHHPLSLPVLLQQMREEQLDYIVSPPAVLNMLLQQPELLQGIDFKRLRTIGSGGAPLSPWMVRGFQEQFGVDIVNHFGSNEGASLAGTVFEIADPEQRATYFSRTGVEGISSPLASNNRNRTRLVDLNSGEIITQNGVRGELRFSGPTVFSCYWNAPEVTANAFDADGFYRTGDLFEIAGDRQQFYRFVGRAKDIVIRGGINISAEEIEAMALEHPAVREAAVVGYPDPVMGERVCLVAALHDGQTATLEDIKTFLKNNKKVAIYKLPERLMLVDALPRNPVGKILKRDLREQAKAHMPASGDAA